MSYHPVQIDVVTTPAPFECTSCPERRFFTQRQVLFRHIREKHQARFECSCPGCDHKWTQSRTSEYRKHLKNKHGLEDDEIDMLLAQPPVVENDIPSHLSHPPVNVHHASTPLIPYVSHGSRLEDGEPEHTTTEHGGCGLEQLAATHAPRILSEEDFALLVRHHNIYGGFRCVHAFLYLTHMIDSALRFPSGHAGTGTTANVPPDLGISHIPALPAQQPGMQGP